MPIWDFESGGVIFQTSGSMGIDSDGHPLMRLSNTSAMDLDTGEIHLVSGWDSEEYGE